MLDDDRLAAVARAFEDAALGNANWKAAVERFADAFNLRSGQLVGFGRESLVSLNIMTGVGPTTAAEMAAVHHPSVNSRVRIGGRIPELQFADERSFTTLEDMRAHREYGDWIAKRGIGYSCVTPLLRECGMLVGLAAFRGRSQDEFVGTEKRAFMAVATRVRSAVNLAMSLERGHAKSFVTGLEGLATTAFVCDPQGGIVSASADAERILAEGRFGRVADGAFVPLRAQERDRFNKALAQAITARIGIGTPPPRPVVLTAADGERLLVEFAPLPQDSIFAFTSAAMVILRGGNSRADRLADIARELFALTPAETIVAAQLFRGRSPQAMADEIGISVGTVRNHVHRILSKSGCGSQIEFVTAVNCFG